MLNEIAPRISEMPSVLLVFLEGLASFISPCILPMLPVYIIYLSGNQKGNKRKLLVNTIAFVLGFTTVFVLMGAAASSVGFFLRQHSGVITRIAGVIMIVFGLSYMGVIKIPFLNNVTAIDTNKKDLKFFSSYVFGAAFSLGWSPCTGPLLGSALLLASNSKTVLSGVWLLFCYSMGLGLPFIITSLFWDRLEKTVKFLKKHFRIIQIISGGILVVVGFLMLFDLFKYYLRLFN